jgi:hypothetical protein
MGRHGRGQVQRHRPLAVVCQMRRGRAARSPHVGAPRDGADERRADCRGIFCEAIPLDANPIAREGKAAPAIAPTPARTPAGSVSHGTKDTIVLTVRLDPGRYRRLAASAAGFVPRKTRQDILVEALDAHLNQVAAWRIDDSAYRRKSVEVTMAPYCRHGSCPWSGCESRTWERWPLRPLR